MNQELNIVIRKYSLKDRDEVRRIFHDTAFMGEPASIFFEGREIISDALTVYFTDYEPQSCFIAEVNGKVAGCLNGARSKVIAENIFKDKIAPNLLKRALVSGVLFKKKNLILFLNSLLNMCKGGLKEPNFTKEYPATLHINVKKEFRGLNIGSRLIGAFLDYLKEEKISGVHLATMSDKGAQFFYKQGFRLLHKGKRSYFSHILHRDVPLYIFGKKV